MAGADQNVPGSSLPPPDLLATSFEKQRGVATVEIREGFAQVQIVELKSPISESAIPILELIGSNGLSIDFLKFTQNGLSFLIPEGESCRCEELLATAGHRHSVKHDRHVVLVFAVNMRDEEGLLAHVMRAAISSGVSIEHVTDMHDRMLMVVDSASSGQLAATLRAFHLERGGYAL